MKSISLRMTTTAKRTTDRVGTAEFSIGLADQAMNATAMGMAATTERIGKRDGTSGWLIGVDATTSPGIAVKNGNGDHTVGTPADAESAPAMSIASPKETVATRNEQTPNTCAQRPKKLATNLRMQIWCEL